MSDHAKVSITLKAGGNQADPWVVIHADSVDEASALLREMVDQNVFTGVKALSNRFAGVDATGQAVETVKQRFPGAEVAQDDDPWAGTAATSQRQELPGNQGVRCPTCNGPTEFKQGTSKSSGKPYKMHKCTANRDHDVVWA